MPEKEKFGIFDKIIFSIGGFLIGTLVIVLSLRILNSYLGAVLGIFVNIGLYYYLTKKKTGQKDKQMVAKGIASSIVFTVILAIALWSFVTAIFQDIAS